jgi:hypothetical protein
MNMPSRNGGPIHQIVAQHPSRSLEEFVDELEENHFVIVEEYYKDSDASKAAPSYYSVGKTALNRIDIGKIKPI